MLKNGFSWSFSRHNTFCDCLKKYWYTYYGSWNGWPLYYRDPRKSVDSLAAYLYKIKQIQSLPMFIGTVIHSSIENNLKKYFNKNKDLTLELLIDDATKHFNKGLDNSHSEKWQKKPKQSVNLFEIYYDKRGVGTPLNEKTVSQAKEKINTCLKNWFNSSVFKKLILDNNTKLLSIEKLDSFLLNDLYKVYVVIDLAIEWKDIFILFDWKTGKEQTKDFDQLYSYAIYATKTWQADTEKIILSPFYLNNNTYHKLGYQQKSNISLEKLSDIKTFMENSCREMVKKLKSNVNKADKIDKNFLSDTYANTTDFPCTENRERCPTCPFLEICMKADFKNLEEENLREILPK